MNADREHRLELSLRNCLALARRMQSKDPDAWGHIIRFCREAGIEPSILRDAEPGVDGLEARAAEIYGGFEYDGPGEKPPWVPGGNSFKQDEARTIARLEANDAKVAEAAVMTAYPEARRELPPGALAEAMRHAATLLQPKGLAPKTIIGGDLVRHLGALRRCVERTRKLDDCGAESGSSWQSPGLESDIEAADKALAFIFDMFGVPSEVK